MSKRKKITELLSNMVMLQLRDPQDYWASEVTFDWGMPTMTRVDFMRFEPVNNRQSGLEKGIFYCFEIKSSLADYRSKNGHNFFGEKNYYIMPMEVYVKLKGEFPHDIGVYCPVPKGKDKCDEVIEPTDIMTLTLDNATLMCMKPAHLKTRDKSNLECLFNMFRSGL